MNPIDHLPGNIGWKDTNLRYMGCNANLLHAFHLKSPDAIIGLRDWDLNAQSEVDIAFHFEKDQQVLQGQTLEYFHHTEEQCYWVCKKPLLDSSHQINGLIYHCLPVPNSGVFAKAFSAQGPNPYRLSKRELECLLSILRGESSKTIAHSLGLSKRTIEFYIENIKNKMGCLTRAELILTAIRSGYDEY